MAHEPSRIHSQRDDGPISSCRSGSAPTLALAAGVVARVMPAVALPAGEATPLTSHLTRELSSAFVFLGLMFFWCIRHYEQRRPVHMAFLVFIALFVGVHWHDYFRERMNVMSPLVNSVPVALLLITAPLRRS